MDEETRAYFEEMRRELAGVRGGLADLHRDLEALDRTVDTQAQETRRQFGVVAEALRAEIQTVAEGVAANTGVIERLRSEIHQEMDERFTVVHAAFAQVRRDIDAIRPRR